MSTIRGQTTEDRRQRIEESRQIAAVSVQLAFCQLSVVRSPLLKD